MTIKQLITAALVALAISITGLAHRQAAATPNSTAGAAQAKKPSEQPKKDDSIKLSDDDLKEIKQLQEALAQLSKDRQQAITSKQAADAALAAVEARMSQAQALAEARRNRICAKLKLDPDEWEWSEDLTALKKKQPTNK